MCQGLRGGRNLLLAGKRSSGWGITEEVQSRAAAVISRIPAPGRDPADRMECLIPSYLFLFAVDGKPCLVVPMSFQQNHL